MSELLVMVAMCRMSNFCGVCWSTKISPLVIITAGGFCLTFIFCKVEHDWARRFCTFLTIKASAWFLAVRHEREREIGRGGGWGGSKQRVGCVCVCVCVCGGVLGCLITRQRGSGARVKDP